MSHLATLLILLLLKILHATESKSIPDLKSPLSMPFAKVQEAEEKTICPYKVTTNFNANRWPNEIKEINCITPKEKSCCGHNYQCTQLIDKVIFHNIKEDRDYEELINAGCVCMKIEDSAPIMAEKAEVF